MTPFQLFFVPLCASIGLVLLARSVRGQMPRRNAAFWAALWWAAAVFIATPSSTTTIARWLGIGRGADLVFYLAILAGGAACLYFYTRCRKLEIMVTDVIRREALAKMHQRPDSQLTSASVGTGDLQSRARAEHT